MKLSVIIPAFNHLEMVMRCYASVLATTDRALTEVLIQDDASSEYNGPLVFDGIAAGLLNTKNTPRICERNSPNLGFPGNCNAGARRAQGDILLFLNQDCSIEPGQAGWDAKLVQFFVEHERAGVVGLTLLFPSGHVQSVGGLFDAKGQPFHQALGYANPDWQPINTARPVSWVTGGAFAVRHGLWNMLGGFDTAYGRGYFEDVDFCVRAQLSNYEVWHNPAIRFVHEVGSTGGNPSFSKNASLFKRKYVDTGVVQPDVPVVKERFW